MFADDPNFSFKPRGAPSMYGKRIRELAGLLLFLAACAGPVPALSQGRGKCLVNADWKTRADNGDLITMKVIPSGTYFEFPKPVPRSGVQYGSVERLAFRVEFKPTPGRKVISVPLVTDGNNGGFTSQLYEMKKSGMVAVGSSKRLPKGQKRTIRINYKAPLPPRHLILRIAADARGKTWGTLGQVRVCPS